MKFKIGDKVSDRSYGLPIIGSIYNIDHNNLFGWLYYIENSSLIHFENDLTFLLIPNYFEDHE